MHGGGCVWVCVAAHRCLFEDLQSSILSLFFFFKAAGAEGKSHGPTGLWGQWFWTIHGPRPLISTDQTLHTPTCPSVSASASCKLCWAVRLSPSLSAISLLPCNPLRHSCCLLVVNWPWGRLLWQIWMATSFLIQKCLNSSLVTNFL